MQEWWAKHPFARFVSNNTGGCDNNQVKSGCRWMQNNTSRRSLLHSCGTARCGLFRLSGSRPRISSPRATAPCAFPTGNAHGSEMDQGELQRYLLEMAWFPTAWLSDAIEWQALD